MTGSRRIISVRSIPYLDQRYPTVGDWELIDDCLYISVSDMTDWRFMLLVAVHELVEAELCLHRGISQKSVDDFDQTYEANRDPGDESEPGDTPNAPYRHEHRQAENIERLLADYLGVDWQEYEAALAAL